MVQIIVMVVVLVVFGKLAEALPLIQNGADVGGESWGHGGHIASPCGPTLSQVGIVYVGSKLQVCILYGRSPCALM
eukprot:1151750-Pelagomonas_calceolata.AAC.5